MSAFIPIISGLVGLIFIGLMIFVLLAGIRVKKELTLRAGVKTTVIKNFFTGMPKLFTFHFESADASAPISGTYTVRHYILPFIPPISEEKGEVVQGLTVKRYWLDSRFEVDVVMNQDAVLRIS